MPSSAQNASTDWAEAGPSLPLVLLPGTLCDHRVFAPMLAHLRGRVTGLTTQVIQTDSCSSVPAAVQYVLEHAPEHFALLGFSLGGIVAMHVAAQAPKRVCGLALVDSTPSPVPEPQHEIRRAGAAGAARLGLRSYLEQHLWTHYVAAARQGDTTLQEQMHEMAVAVGAEALARQTELLLTRPDARGMLASLAMPALVLAGEEDRLCPVDVQLALAAALPRATLALVPGAGHFALMEKPDAVAAPVAAWFHILARP